MRRFWRYGGLASSLALPVAAAIAVVLAISLLWDITHLGNDAAQYLSVARNILRGDGVATSILFYEQQLTAGQVPAPQTVFPPGMSMVLAVFMAAGLSPPTAILVAGVLGFGATGIVLAVLLRRLGVGPLPAFLGVAIWLGQGTAWGIVMLGLSEILYTLATLLSVTVLLYAEGRWSRLGVAGGLAAAAVLIRYQGLFFIAALGLHCAWTWLRSPPGQRSRQALQAVALLTLPLVAVGILLVRNLLLTGSPGGGPIDSAYWNAAHGFDVVRSMYWALVPFFGLSVDGLLQFRWQEISVVAGLLMLTGWLSRNLRELSSPATSTGDRHVRVTFARFVLCYVVVTSLVLVYLATRSTGYLQGRYLLPLVPFIAAVWVLLLERIIRIADARGRVVLFAALLSLHAGFFAGQWSVLHDWLDMLRADGRIAKMRMALAEEIDGLTLHEFLQQRVSNDAPLLATGGQLLWVLLESPVVETTPAGFSAREWDEAELRRLRRCLGVRYLLYIPGVFEAERPENRNQLTYHQLARGHEPAGLTPLLRTPRVRFYEIEAMTMQSAKDAQNRRHVDCN